MKESRFVTAAALFLAHVRERESLGSACGAIPVLAVAQ